MVWKGWCGVLDVPGLWCINYCGASIVVICCQFATSIEYNFDGDIFVLSLDQSASFPWSGTADVNACKILQAKLYVVHCLNDLRVWQDGLSHDGHVSPSFQRILQASVCLSGFSTTRTTNTSSTHRS